MIHKPYPCRELDDDYAPADYTYVASVSEGRRREQQKNIAREPERAVARHRADPYERERVDAYGTRASVETPQRRSTVAGRLPSIADGPAPASRIAYPGETEIPENPFDPPAEDVAAARQGRRRAAPAEPLVTADGSQFDPPAMARMPEWYRVAQQNGAPRDERRRRAPQVQAAPRYDEEPQEPVRDLLGRPLRGAQERVSDEPPPANAYEEAGYPEDLVLDQRQADDENNRIGRRRHHGAQAAVNRARQEEYERSVQQRGDQPDDRASYPPTREEYGRRRVLSDEEREQRAQAAARAREENAARAMGRGSAYTAAFGQSNQPYAEDYQENPYARQQPRREFPPQNHPNDPNYPDWQEDEAQPKRLVIPWLGIGVFAVAIIAVALWVMQVTFTSRTEQALADRVQAVAVLRSQHPYDYRALIEREAAKNNLNPAFVAAIVLNESSFRTDAESNVGARGLMQVMAETAGEIGGKLNVSGYSFDMLYDAETNVTFGCYYLGQLSQRFRGDPVLVSAAYHAGATQVQNWLNTSTYSSDGLTLILDNMDDGPTKQYATRVKRDFAIYRKLYYETSEDDA